MTTYRKRVEEVLVNNFDEHDNADDSDDDSAAFWQVERPAWFARARCGPADSHLFFPPDHLDALEREHAETAAQAICRACLVRVECTAYAMADLTLTGVWGGTTEKQRRELRRQRKRNGAA